MVVSITGLTILLPPFTSHLDIRADRLMRWIVLVRLE